MMKKIALCACLTIAWATCAWAQQTGLVEKPLQAAAPAAETGEVFYDGGASKGTKAPVVSRSLELGENEIWWGYFNGRYRAHEAEDLMRYGSVKPVTYACGIKLRAQSEFDMGKGKTIEGIKFVLPDVKNMEDVKIWMTTTLPDTTDMSLCDICVQSIDKADLVQALHSTSDHFTNEIRFDTPYTIGDKDIYVGYSFRMTKVEDDLDQTPIVIDNVAENILSREGAFIRRYNTSKKWSEDTDYGILAMQVLLSSADFKSHAVEIEADFEDVAMQKNTTAVLPLTMTNVGKKGIQSFKYVTTSAGKVIDEQTVTLETPVGEVGGRLRYDFPLKSGDSQGVYPTEIKITEVNGVENESSKNTCQGEAVVVESVPQRTVFIEDYTSTWAGGYAYGLANKLKLREMYGDQVAVVSVHNGMADPMTPKEYNIYVKTHGIKYFPNTDIDRTFHQVYPYLGSEDLEYFTFAYDKEFQQALKLLTVATVDVEGVLNEDQSTVDVEARVKFAFSGEKRNYALFYVITEDGMQDDSWTQDNIMGDYAGMGLEEKEPLLEPFINGEEQMTGLVYDDVVVASKGVMEGIEGSISSSIKIDEVQSHQCSFNLADYPIIQDKTQLTAYAVLIDTQSGKVVNVGRSKVVKAGETAIGSTMTDQVVEVARYTADGRKVSQPVAGINIVRYSDGKVVKRVVR